MSRIGKLPISIPAGVTVSVDDENVVSVKGPKGEMSQAVYPPINIHNKVLHHQSSGQKLPCQSLHL